MADTVAVSTSSHETSSDAPKKREQRQSIGLLDNNFARRFAEIYLPPSARRKAAVGESPATSTRKQLNLPIVDSAKQAKSDGVVNLVRCHCSKSNSNLQLCPIIQSATQRERTNSHRGLNDNFAETFNAKQIARAIDDVAAGKDNRRPPRDEPEQTTFEYATPNMQKKTVAGEKMVVGKAKFDKIVKAAKDDELRRRCESSCKDARPFTASFIDDIRKLICSSSKHMEASDWNELVFRMALSTREITEAFDG